MMLLKRRDFLKVGAAAGAMASLYGCAGGGKANGHVVVVGGGYGGATVAKYLRMWSEGGVQVTLIERNPTFISCPISNLVIGGTKTMEDITISYDGLKNKWGVRVIQDDVVAVDAAKRSIKLAKGGDMTYDRLVLSPGVDFMFDQIPGLNNADAQSKILHAWKAGAQTVALRKQLEDMKDGGVYAISIPKAPYRCPPGPYERACLVANYFKQSKPKSKVVILDANEDVTSKKGLFTKAWTDLYKGIIEYRNNSEVKDVEVGTNTAVLEFDKFKADVLNIIPPHRAGDIAAKSGIKLINNRWVDINWLSDGIDQHAGHPCSGRRHLPGAYHAKIRSHGQPARQARRCGNSQPAIRHGTKPDASGDEHLLQLCRCQKRHSRLLRPSIRCRNQDRATGKGCRRYFGGT
jgi:sulfide dehydrogenase [flavocytochrome c] flavoprotein subunit